jgi:hypothetical protein
VAVESLHIASPYPVTETTLRALGQWAFALASVFGVEVLRELGGFSRAAGPGAMITIKRTRDGFTAQVTGAIVGGRGVPVTVGELESITLETLEATGTQGI